MFSSNSVGNPSRYEICSSMTILSVISLIVWGIIVWSSSFLDVKSDHSENRPSRELPVRLRISPFGISSTLGSVHHLWTSSDSTTVSLSAFVLISCDEYHFRLNSAMSIIQRKNKQTHRHGCTREPRIRWVDGLCTSGWIRPTISYFSEETIFRGLLNTSVTHSTPF